MLPNRSSLNAHSSALTPGGEYEKSFALMAMATAAYGIFAGTHRPNYRRPITTADSGSALAQRVLRPRVGPTNRDGRAPQCRVPMQLRLGCWRHPPAQFITNFRAPIRATATVGATSCRRQTIPAIRNSLACTTFADLGKQSGVGYQVGQESEFLDSA